MFDPPSQEYVLLSDDGKADCEKRNDFRKKKMEAISSHHFEQAADLRFAERIFEKKIRNDFAISTNNKYFVLIDKKAKSIVYNDFDGKLEKFFKLV